LTATARGSRAPAAEGIRPKATAKLRRSIALGGAALFFALLTGRIEFVVLVAPMLTALAAAVAGPRLPGLTVGVSLDRNQCLEGEHVIVTIEITSSTRIPELELGLVVPTGFQALDGATIHVIGLLAGERRTVPIRLRAFRWGSWGLGRVAARTFGPGRFLSFEQVFEDQAPVKVFPAFERLHRAIQPDRTQVFSGDYTARAAGEGIEFTDVRPFTTGDRVRRVNWRVSSRRDGLYVNRFHPERNADVVLLLDTFADVGPAGSTSLDLSVRGAAVLARHYLERKDRVGLVSFGGVLHWLSASSARVQTYRIVDYLLAIDVHLSYAWKDIHILPPGTLPPMALVVAFSPLEDERAFHALVDLRARGFSVVVVDTLAEELVEPLSTPPGKVAHRAWRLEREGLHFRLATLGIPAVRWSGEESLEAVLAGVPRFRRRTRAVSR
jgi:uncharacterized protein (DUF58 family)